MLISTNAIVLKTIPYSDTSLIVRLFTEDQGKITVIAKGARRPKSPFASSLEPMNILNVNYYHKDSRDVQTLKNSSFNEKLFGIRNNITKICMGQTMVEILDKTTHVNDPMPVLYRLITQTLKQLVLVEKKAYLIFWFYLIQLAIRTGFKPNLEVCSICHTSLRNATMNINSGELCCDSCLNPGVNSLNQSSLFLLQNISKTHLDQIHKLEYQQPQVVKINNFLIKFLKYHLEGMDKVKSIKILYQLTQ